MHFSTCLFDLATCYMLKAAQWLKDRPSLLCVRQRCKESAPACLPFPFLSDSSHSCLHYPTYATLQWERVLHVGNCFVPCLKYSCAPFPCNPQSERFQSWETASLSCPPFTFPLDGYPARCWAWVRINCLICWVTGTLLSSLESTRSQHCDSSW